jgi:uncharacterized protein YndB with AHSA1/START domain
MTTVVRTHQVLVRAPLQSVFEYVSDLTRHPEWSDGKLEIEAVTPGPIAAGKEYRSRGEVAVQKNRPNTIRVTEYEPLHLFGFVANDPDAGDVSHLFTLTEQDGQVLIQRMMTLSLNPIVAFLFRLFVYPLIGSPSMEKSLRLLKSKLEERGK